MKNDSVSIAKGLAIILMVLAHTYFNVWGCNFINMFHMPLFFFFSGYCFKVAYLSDFKHYTRQKIRGIYWPYVKWCVIFLLIHNIFAQWQFYEQGAYTLHDMTLIFADIILRMFGADQLLGGFWFLRTMFWASFISYGMIKMLPKNKNLIVGGGHFIATLTSIGV